MKATRRPPRRLRPRLSTMAMPPTPPRKDRWDCFIYFVSYFLFLMSPVGVSVWKSAKPCHHRGFNLSLVFALSILDMSFLRGSVAFPCFFVFYIIA